MSTKKTAATSMSTTTAKQDTGATIFRKENYMWMLIGLVVLALGFFLMAGGKSDNPNVFQKDEIYSFVRITLSPLLIIIGFVIEIYAIMRKPKTN